MEGDDVLWERPVAEKCLSALRKFTDSNPQVWIACRDLLRREPKTDHNYTPTTLLFPLSLG